MTVDHGSGASSTAPQTDPVAQSDTAQSDTVQTDTGQAAVPADAAGATSPAPADTGSDVATTQDASDQPATADAATSVDRPPSEPAGATDQTALNGDVTNAHHHAGRGMGAALASLVEGIGKADPNQISLPHAQAIEHAAHHFAADGGGAPSAGPMPTGADAAFAHHHAFWHAW